MEQKFYETAVRIQDASNIVAVTGELREAMIAVRADGRRPGNSIACLALFYKVYDMMGAPSEKDMYEALQKCEKIVAGEETDP
jgi:hypothetical protein